MEATMLDDGTTGMTTMARPNALVRWIEAGIRQVRHLVRALAHRQELKQLSDYDDRALKDIGLLRSDVAGALAEPFHVDPTKVLLVRRVERRARARMAAIVPRIPAARPVPAERRTDCSV
jgi:uncharacterized protein YjiS (DUF1127 family)